MKTMRQQPLGDEFKRSSSRIGNHKQTRYEYMPATGSIVKAPIRIPIRQAAIWGAIVMSFVYERYKITFGEAYSFKTMWYVGMMISLLWQPIVCIIIGHYSSHGNDEATGSEKPRRMPQKLAPVQEGLARNRLEKKSNNRMLFCNPMRH